MVRFLQICLERAGADSMITPREMLRDYMTVLNILMQNPDASFETVVGRAVTLTTAAGDAEDAPKGEEDAPEKKVFTLEDIEF